MPVIFTDDEELNETLNIVYRSAVEDTLAKIPRFILHMLQSTQEIVQLNVEFYQRNPDLYEYRPHIAAAFTRIQQQSPDLDNAAVLEKAGAAVRRAMQLKEDIHGQTAVQNRPGQNRPGSDREHRQAAVPHGPAFGKTGPGPGNGGPRFPPADIVIE